MYKVRAARWSMYESSRRGMILWVRANQYELDVPEKEEADDEHGYGLWIEDFQPPSCRFVLLRQSWYYSGSSSLASRLIVFMLAYPHPVICAPKICHSYVRCRSPEIPVGGARFASLAAYFLSQSERAGFLLDFRRLARIYKNNLTRFYLKLHEISFANGYSTSTDP